MTIAFEPFDPALRADPYTAYRRLRDEAPVHYAPDADVWCVSRYEDVMHVLKEHETFSSHGMRIMLMQGGREGPPPFEWRLFRFIALVALKARMHPRNFGTARGLIMEDGAEHSEMRTIVNRGFTPRGIASLEPRVREVAAECLAPLVRGEAFDVMRDLAIPLPVTMIAELLGIEPEMRETFKGWTDTVIESISTNEGRADRLAEPFVDMFVNMSAYLRKTAKARRKSPKGDLISQIVAVQDGRGLSDYDIVTFVMVLLIAGNETTTNLIGNTVHALFDHPDQLEKVIADPSLIEPAIEEGVRFDGPVQMLFRQTTRETEIRGVTIPKGAMVAPILGSANRDERQFADPDRFDVERRAQGHVGFGFGKHFCLGSSLARLEARCVLEALLPHLAERARVVEPREWVDSFLVRGPTRLRLEAR